ncbi:unnamed protein product, partial [Iphiclides podalirius]
MCLRSETEVRLTAPLVFRKALGALKYMDTIRSENVCYMCEARAATVARFVDMLQLAVEIQLAFENSLLATGKKRKKRVREYVDNYHGAFTKMRAQNELNSTQVLHVDAIIADNSIGPKRRTEVIRKRERKRAPPEIETVVIDDDSSNGVTQVAGAQTPPPNGRAAGAPNTSIGADSLVYIMPVNPGLPNGSLYLLPTASGQMPTISQVNGSVSVPLEKRARREEEADDDVQIVNGDLDSNPEDGLPGERLLNQVVKLPIRTETRVDWEDMIPMEVIACADDMRGPTDTLREATNELLKDLQKVIDMAGTVE